MSSVDELAREWATSITPIFTPAQEEEDPDTGFDLNATVEEAREERKADPAPEPVEEEMSPVQKMALDKAEASPQMAERLLRAWLGDQVANTMKQAEYERAKRAGTRLVDAEEAASDIAGPPVVRSIAESLERELPDTTWSIEGLLCSGGRAVFGGYRKAGKTTAILNLLAAWGAGGQLFGEFQCAGLETGNIVWLNLELPEDTAEKWIQRMAWGKESSQVYGFHMRGRIPNITVQHGYQLMVKLLKDANCKRLVLDPVSPFMSACGLSNMDERDVQTFLNTWERIALEVGIEEIVYVAHVSKSDAKANDGEDTVMGHGRWEAAADAIWIMGKEKDSQTRWFKAEGRDVDVPNTVLDYDPVTGSLRMGTGSMRGAAMDARVEQVVKVVEMSPGINAGSLRGHAELTGDNKARTAAISEAISRGQIKVIKGKPGEGNKHYPLDWAELD